MSKYILLSIIFISIFTSCSQEMGPKEVIKAWLMHKSKGECEQAFNLELDNYHRNFDEYECQEYQLEIKDINCTIEGETAVCGCYESREGNDTKQYYYNLKQVDGTWKVQPYS